MIGSGLQGMMFAVRFASIKLAKQIVGARVNAADQFTVQINQGATTIARATTTGTGTTVTGGATALTQVTSGTNYALTEIAAGARLT
jgi:hypothetical protein